MSKPTMGVTINSSLGYFGQVLKNWPSIKAGMLSEIGYVGRKTLQYNYLRGQVIMLRVYPYDKRGEKYRTVSYSLNKKLTAIKIAAYPLNLYKPREVYASASGQVKAACEQALAAYDGRILQDRLDKMAGGK